jgi:hypothetical protein
VNIGSCEIERSFLEAEFAMDIHEIQPDDEPVDRAIAARLAKLQSMPVDTSRLERQLRAQIPARPARLAIGSRWLRPMRAAVAASFLLVAGMIALLVSTSGGPVLASTTEMAQFHNDLVSGRVPVTRVDSMQAANQALAAQWAQSPQVPNMPNDHVMACCMRSVKNKKMACVLLKGDGEPVTLTVANASDMQTPTSPIMTRNGIQYHVQSAGSLNMVMTDRGGRWVCLIAKLPPDRLMDLASSLEF